ncbi:hypothetical protein GINT2_000060 [Glugoides intestinalis]
MFSFFFNSVHSKSEWHLKPSKFPKDSENNCSSKVLLPHYILQDLVNLNFQPPYVFEITHENRIYKTVCSVLDFLLEEEEIIVPSWMFEQLCLDTSGNVILKFVELENGEGVKLLPHTTDFLEVENPKKELENTLKNYHVLTYGDEIMLQFADIGICRFTVTKVYPEDLDTIYIVDTDLKTDFDEPLGYKEKIESEKSIMKYVDIKSDENSIKTIKLSKPSLFVGWSDLKHENQ